ncbi:MAG: acyltransferase [Opitutae bacterium]
MSTTLTLQLPAPAQKRLPVLDELKGLAIILIVLYHAGGVLVWQNLLHGDVGVDMFVIISGIGLTLGGSYTNAQSFLLRRFSRILPAYWVALAFYWALNSYFLQHHYTPLNIGLHFLGVHACFGDQYAMGINDSFWFITLILFLYCQYCIVRRWLAQPDRLLVVGMGTSVGLALICFYWNQPAVFGHLTLRLPGFFIGLVVGESLRRGRLEIPLSWQLGLAVFIYFYVPYTQGIIIYSPLVGGALMLGYALGLRPGLSARAQNRLGAILEFFGRYSLEIFLFHQPLIREYVYYSLGRFLHIVQPSSLQLIGAMTVGFALTLLISVELHRFINWLLFNRKGALPA